MTTPHGNHPIESLSAYLDGALDPGERADVERHLADCAECARTLEALRTLASDFRDEAVPEIPQGLEAKVRAALDGEANVVPFAPRRRWAIPATMAATLGAVALLVVAVRMGVVETRAPRESETDEAIVRAAEALPPPPPAANSAPESLAEDRAIDEDGRKRKETDEVAKLRSLGDVGPPERKREEAAQVPSEEPRAETEFARAPEPAPSAAAPSPRRDASLEKVAMDRLAAAGSAGDETRARYHQTVITLAPHTDCRSPFEVGDRRVVWTPSPGTDGEAQLAGAARRQGGQLYARVEEPDRRRVLEVSTARWPAFRDELRTAGVEGLDDLPEPPPSADCVRVWVTIRPDPTQEPR